MKYFLFIVCLFSFLIAKSENRCVGFYGLSMSKKIGPEIWNELKSKSKHDFQKAISFRTKSGRNLFIVEGGNAIGGDIERVKQRFISVFDSETMEQVGRTINSAPRITRYLMSSDYALNVSESPEGQLVFLVNNFSSNLYFIVTQDGVRKVNYNTRTPNFFGTLSIDYDLILESNLIVAKGMRAFTKTKPQTIEVFEATNPEKSLSKLMELPPTDNDFATSAERDLRTGKVFASVVLSNQDGTMSGIIYEQNGTPVYNFRHASHGRRHPYRTNFVHEGSDLVAVLRFVSPTAKSDYFDETEIRFNLSTGQAKQSDQVIFLDSSRSDW